MHQPAPPFAPTAEQQHAIDLFLTGKNVVINAGAGTGKTATLRMIADAAPHKKGLYLAFNKAIAQEAERKFAGTNVTAINQHRLAYRSHGHRFQHRLKKRPDDIVNAGSKGKHLGVTTYYFESGDGAAAASMHPTKIVGIVTRTVKAFMKSAAPAILPEHVELSDDLTGMKDAAADKLRAQIVRYAEAYWADLTDPDGKLRFEHDAYVKMWALSEPVFDYDYILFDEAQDADLIMIDILSKQKAQLITVGDRQQQIYEWRGSKDSMDAFDGEHAALTQSFRFGQGIADYANRWLRLLGSPLEVVGNPNIASRALAPKKVINTPNAILCRTNATAISEIIDYQELGLRVGIAGERKAKELRDLAIAADDLQRKGYTKHAELVSFNTWGDVVTHAKSDDGEDIRPLVELIERMSPRKIVQAIDQCVPTDQAEVTISTAHVAKGLEWRYVRIADDFREPKRKKGAIQPIPTEEARLIYVAVTRAQKNLDITALGWLDDYLAEGGWVEGGPMPDAGGAVHMEGAADSAAREEHSDV